MSRDRSDNPIKKCNRDSAVEWSRQRYGLGSCRELGMKMLVVANGRISIIFQTI
jgi:hypothetical protein